MIRYILKRLMIMVPVVIGVTILIFTILYFVPGDPAETILGNSATAETVALKREMLGLNDPFYVRLFKYMKGLFLHFDLGKSYVTTKSVTEEILSRFPRTLTLAFFVMLLRAAAGIPLGILAAVHQNDPVDRICMSLALLGCSMPSFWLALMLILVFSLQLGWLPSFGIVGFKSYILPCIAASIIGIAQQARITRSSMLDVIRADFVTTARAKGLSERNILYLHTLPNALIPVVTVIGNGFGMGLAGTIIIENVFSIPGIGLYLTNGVADRDYPVVTGSVVFLCICLSVVMLIVDLVYAYIDPRIKAQYENQAGAVRRKMQRFETKEEMLAEGDI